MPWISMKVSDCEADQSEHLSLVVARNELKHRKAVDTTSTVFARPPKLQSVYAVLLAAEDKIGVFDCREEICGHQETLGMFGFKNVAWQAGLVEAALNTTNLQKMQKEGEYMLWAAKHPAKSDDLPTHSKKGGGKDAKSNEADIEAILNVFDLSQRKGQGVEAKLGDCRLVEKQSYFKSR
ncbi:hypothetical protein ABBQ32_010969 [Trebouxia sp. C0010 RCD-2024]